ncbi:hypothetical protein ABIB42_004075, partial [Massilia sp. UYP32]|uniref:hypothetical protein n=1 Tax=Massilia sp. UYP32 TaxID=1756386 RepID=UPI003D1C9952
FLGFLVVITSVMEQSFRDYFMTPFHTEILTGSEGQELYKYFATGLIVDDSPLDWTSSPASPGRIPEKITNKR